MILLHRRQAHPRVRRAERRGVKRKACGATDIDDETQLERRNMTFHRQLCLAVLSNDLIKISSYVAKPATVERFYHFHKDHGASYFQKATNTDPTVPISRDREFMAYYITRKSVKLGYLCSDVIRRPVRSAIPCTLSPMTTAVRSKSRHLLFIDMAECCLRTTCANTTVPGYYPRTIDPALDA